MKLRQLGYAIAAVALLAGGVLAEDTKRGTGAKKAGPTEADMKAMMEAWEKAGTPGEQHKTLQRYAGKWNLKLKHYMAPGQPPKESTGTAEAKSIFGNRFIQWDVKSTWENKPFTGLGYTGYDNLKKKIVSTWMDSMSTAIMVSEGTIDAAGKNIITTGTCTDPMTGKEMTNRMVEKWENDNKFVEEFYKKHGGRETKEMEIVYTRVSK